MGMWNGKKGNQAKELERNIECVETWTAVEVEVKSVEKLVELRKEFSAPLLHAKNDEIFKEELKYMLKNSIEFRWVRNLCRYAYKRRRYGG